MDTEKLSVLACFDDIRRCASVLTDGTAEIEFYRFAASQEQVRVQWLRAVEEAQRIQRELDATLQNVAGLETKLYHARRLLEAETKNRKEAERDRDNLQTKMQQAHELLYSQPNINEETRTKFAFLGNDDRYQQKRRSRRHSDAYGNEINSTGSILSELSVTQSEDDFLDEALLQPRTLRRHQPAVGDANASFIGTKRTRSSMDGNKRKSSTLKQPKTIDIGMNDKIVASTRVSIPQGNGPITAESVIEAIPDHESGAATQKRDKKDRATPQKNRSSTTMKRTFSPTAPILHEVDNDNENDVAMPPTPHQHHQKAKAPKPPQQQSAQPQQSHPSAALYTASAPRSGTATPSSSKHSFSSRTFLKSDICVYCQKKIKFGTTSLKCRTCRIFVHTDCESRLNMVCIPASTNGPSTPKGLVGMITDYSPSTSPMVPGIIVHCVNEIESRGLNEVGIYRVSGSEKDIKALKERFLRGKTVPPLHSIDVHVLCGCIKDFLRNLREPLIPTSQWCEFSNATQNPSDASVMRDIYRAIGNMPPANRDSLAFLMQHFLRIASAEEVKMPASNLAKVFGPTIVGYSSADPDQHAIFTETIIQASVMERLLSIPNDYWNRYLKIAALTNRYVDPEGESAQYFGTPGLRSARKQKFYATPPYSTTRNNK